ISRLLSPLPEPAPAARGARGVDRDTSTLARTSRQRRGTVSELCENYPRTPAIIGRDRRRAPSACSPIATNSARSGHMVSQLSQHSTFSGRGAVARWRGGPWPSSLDAPAANSPNAFEAETRSGRLDREQGAH